MRGDGRAMRVRIEQGAEGFAETLATAGFGFQREIDGSFRVVVGEGVEDADGFFALAARSGATIAAVDSVRSSLDEVFLRVLREAGGS